MYEDEASLSPSRPTLMAVPSVPTLNSRVEFWPPNAKKMD